MDLPSLLRATRPVSIRSIDSPPPTRVLVLGPHPDDFDAVGVTMRVLQRNSNAISVRATMDSTNAF